MSPTDQPREGSPTRFDEPATRETPTLETTPLETTTTGEIDRSIHRRKLDTSTRFRKLESGQREETPDEKTDF